jgi:hypothetical protein
MQYSVVDDDFNSSVDVVVITTEKHDKCVLVWN